MTSNQLPHRLDRVGHSLWVSWTVRQEDPIGFEGFNLRRGGRSRNDGHITPLIYQSAKDIQFHPEIKGDDMPPPACTDPWLVAERGGPLTLSFRPPIGLPTCTGCRQIPPNDARTRLCLLGDPAGIPVDMSDEALLRPMFTQVAGQGPR